MRFLPVAFTLAFVIGVGGMIYFGVSWKDASSSAEARALEVLRLEEEVEALKEKAVKQEVLTDLVTMFLGRPINSKAETALVDAAEGKGEVELVISFDGTKRAMRIPVKGGDTIYFTQNKKKDVSTSTVVIEPDRGPPLLPEE
ncbi:MAG: hypothetical protein AAB567_00900 [Patescibacteria group bacterium]